MNEDLRKYYFTFGTDEKYPYTGGWVLVYATNIHQANRLFKRKYPNRAGSQCMNCADVYSEKEFDMKETGNFGFYCHDVITPEGTERYDERGLFSNGDENFYVQK